MNYHNDQGELHCSVGDYYRLTLSSPSIVLDGAQPRQPDPTATLARRAMATTNGDQGAAAHLLMQSGVSYVDALHLCMRATKPEPGEQIEPLQRELDGTIATLLRDPAHTSHSVTREVAKATGMTFTEATLRVCRVGQLGYERLDELAGPPMPAANERGYRRMR